MKLFVLLSKHILLELAAAMTAVEIDHYFPHNILPPVVMILSMIGGAVYLAYKHESIDR
jgi:hypothetical protein